jgi:hypothetical protein
MVWATLENMQKKETTEPPIIPDPLPKKKERDPKPLDNKVGAGC